MISLKLSERLNGPKFKAEDLPQDGQRLIYFLEEESKKEITKFTNEILSNWLNNENFIKGITGAILTHVFKTGYFPTYFTSKFIVTHLEDVQKENMKIFDMITQETICSIRKTIKNGN